jgi:hypothetical protein
MTLSAANLTKSILSLSLAAGLLCAGANASAQAPSQAKVPFKFSVGQRVLPPGTYSIKEVASNLIEIENRENGTTLHFSTYPSDCVKGKTNMLVFSKHGDQYFLREVRGGSGTRQSAKCGDRIEQEVVSKPPQRPGD